jgi:hypothetical protein
MQVYDASGNIIVDTSTKLGQILGTVSTGISNGSVTNSAFSFGAPFYFILPSGSGYNVQPDVDITGATLSWSWVTSGESYNNPCTIIYGVY